MPSLNIGFRSPLTGKKKERSEVCEVLTDDGRWVNREMSALYSCVDDEGTGAAFIIDGENQYYDPEDGCWHQLIHEKSEIPICMRKQNALQDGNGDETERAKLGDKIFVTAFGQRISEAIEAAHESEMMNKAVMIVSIICGTILIFFAFNFFGG